MVVHEYFPRDMRVRREARALVEAGLEVAVVCLRKTGQSRRETWQGIEVIRLPVKRHRGRSLPVYLAEYLTFAVGAALTVAARYIRHPFKLVHVHAPPDFLAFSALPVRLISTRLILDIHDLTPELYESRFRGTGGRLAMSLLRGTEKLACLFADRVITVTETFKKNLVSRGIPREKITVLHNCPDPEVFRPTASQSEVPQTSGFDIIHHGTLMRRYGVDLLLDAFAQVVPRLPHARLHIYGEGDLFEELKIRAETPPLREKVILYGEVPQEEVAKALGSADLCVVPNRQDSFTDLLLPTKVLEALQVGCPVVASATRVIADTFASGGVHLVPPNDPRGVAEAIIFLATDQKARRSLIEEGRQQAERFSWTGEKKKLLDLYRETGVQ